MANFLFFYFFWSGEGTGVGAKFALAFPGHWFSKSFPYQNIIIVSEQIFVLFFGGHFMCITRLSFHKFVI